MPSEQNRSLLRRALLRLLWLIAGRRRYSGPLDLSSLRRVLLIRYDRIGDAVITTPLIAALHEHAPGAAIDILATTANATVFRHDPRIADIIIWPSSLPGRLRTILHCRRKGYDATLQLIFGRTSLPAVLAGLMTPGGLTVGRRGKYPLDLMNIPVVVDQVHFADRTHALLFAAAGLPIPQEDVRYSLAIGTDDRSLACDAIAGAGLDPGRFILLNISAGETRRELSIEQNSALVRAMSTPDFPVVVMGAPSARETLEAIAAASGATPMWFPSLTAAAALMEHARMVITPDTSIVHIASAVGAPVLAFYPSDGSPEGWGPLGVPYRILSAPTEQSGTISLEAIVEAAHDLLRETH